MLDFLISEMKQKLKYYIIIFDELIQIMTMKLIFN